MLEYIEKRDYIRMDVDCAARILFDGKAAIAAIVKDLSATGVLVWIDLQVPAGSIGTINILPGKNITPPLAAEIEVIRCKSLQQDSTTFAAACLIKQIFKTDAA